MPFPGRLRFQPARGYATVAAVLAIAALVAVGLRQSGNDAMQTTFDSEQVMLVENFDTHRAGQPWIDGQLYGQWRAEYDGYGTTMVSAEGGYRLNMSPRIAAEPGITHGGLVSTVRAFEDIDVTVQMSTLRQLRQGGSANPWEVAWLLWHYADDHHFYSVALKPNGWELAKEDPEYPGSQRYLVTGNTPVFPLGMQHTVRVRQVGNAMTVWVNGKLLTTYTDNERPYSGGRVGLYAEDAHVAFDSVIVRRP